MSQVVNSASAVSNIGLEMRTVILHF